MFHAKQSSEPFVCQGHVNSQERLRMWREPLPRDGHINPRDANWTSEQLKNVNKPKRACIPKTLSLAEFDCLAMRWIGWPLCCQILLPRLCLHHGEDSEGTRRLEARDCKGEKHHLDPLVWICGFWIASLRVLVWNLSPWIVFHLSCRTITKNSSSYLKQPKVLTCVESPSIFRII